MHVRARGSHDACVALAERTSTPFRSASEPGELAEFDYIVVGAGPAGCVLADRLSASSDARVLVMEAGNGVRPREAAVPSLFPRLVGTANDWSYAIEPEAGLDFR